MPIQISQKVTRRTVLAAAMAAAPALMISQARAGLPQTAVSYQTSPKDGKQCSECKLFVAPKSCKQVSGEIASNGYCKLFVKNA